MKRYLIFSLFLISVLFPMKGQKNSGIDRVDPPCWWVGMKNKEVQLLVHGKNISSLTPSIQYPGVEIKDWVLVENPNYLFVNLVIEESAKPGVMTINFQNGKKRQVKTTYELKERTSLDERSNGLSQKDVIYLIWSNSQAVTSSGRRGASPF